MAHKKSSKLPAGFVQAGGSIFNLAAVAEVCLPVEGDPKQPLTVHMVNGHCVQLAGDDAEAFLGALAAA